MSEPSSSSPPNPIAPEVQPSVALQRRLARHRMLVKLGGIATLALLLLIPLGLLMPIVQDRSALRDSAVFEIQRDWGREQQVIGPILVIPTSQGPTFAFPDELHIKTDLAPEERHRGIYAAIVYAAQLDIEGSFHRPSAADLGVAPEQIFWNQAYVAIAITDLRGTGTQVALRWGTSELPMLPGAELQRWSSGVHVPVTVPDNAIAFSLSLPIHGSHGITFSPLGIKNDVKVRSSWRNPSFTGAFLPATRTITDDGFDATWSVSYYGRDFGQYAKADLPYGVDQMNLGVNLLPGIDSYRSVDRAVRYGVLFIVLAFMSFFLFEVVAKTRIHPFQYAMVGLALGVFFLILLALSELVPFIAAYATAAAGTIGIVATYMVPVLKTGRRTLVAAGLLGASFAVLYVVLQAEDYALLAGSLVVFVALAVTMRITRSLDWYAEDETATGPDRTAASPR
jgi:inner membrane protein